MKPQNGRQPKRYIQPSNRVHFKQQVNEGEGPEALNETHFKCKRKRENREKSI